MTDQEFEDFIRGAQWTPEQIAILERRGQPVVVNSNRGDGDMTTKQEQAEARAERAEHVRADKKPTPQQVGAALHGALKGMVAEAEAAGQRDTAHCQAAKAALEMAEPEEKPE